MAIEEGGKLSAHTMSRYAFQDLATAMKKLGLNPTETEIQDLINEVEMNGYIYYPEFCRIIMRKMREDDEENFHQELYRTFVGPKWTPTEPANLYNVHKEFLTFEQFKMVMTNLPDYVSESQAEEIFRIADRDGNGYISYTEFKASRSYITIAIVPLYPLCDVIIWPLQSRPTDM